MHHETHGPGGAGQPGRRGWSRRALGGLAAAVLTGGVLAPPIAPARAAEPAPPADPALLDDLVLANRILADQGVVDGFGHVSARHDARADRFWLARSMAPALVARADLMEFELDGTAVAPAGRTPYLERFIHGAIYRARPDVMAVVHSHSPGLIPFGVAGGARLRPVFHLAGFLGEGAPVFEIRDAAGSETDLLVSTPELGDALARTLGDGPVVLMRGHGATAVGGGVRQAVFRAVYAEANAKAQAEAMRLGQVNYLNAREAQAAAKTNDAVMGRAWELWKMRVQRPSP